MRKLQLIVFLTLNSILYHNTIVQSFQFSSNSNAIFSKQSLTKPMRMALDDFLVSKLESIKRTFNALTERLADPDIANDRKQMLTLSRERASLEKTVESFQTWQNLEKERLSLVTMDQSPETTDDLKEMVREELKDIVSRQDVLEKEISLLLIPRDPNDHRNVMLEVRSGTGGDEAGIWAGDLVSSYLKYCEAQKWKVN